jgi:anti-anti-sigma factor
MQATAKEPLVDNQLMVESYKDVTVVSFQNVAVLDSANIETLGRNLLDLVEKQDHRKLILEFSAVRFMSSQALGVLLQLKKALDPLGGRVLIAGIRPELHKVFKITNLHKLFTFYDTLDKALQEFNIYIPRG